MVLGTRFKKELRKLAGQFSRLISLLIRKDVVLNQVKVGSAKNEYAAELRPSDEPILHNPNADPVNKPIPANARICKNVHLCGEKEVL